MISSRKVWYLDLFSLTGGEEGEDQGVEAGRIRRLLPGSQSIVTRARHSRYHLYCSVSGVKLPKCKVPDTFLLGSIHGEFLFLTELLLPTSNDNLMFPIHQVPPQVPSYTEDGRYNRESEHRLHNEGLHRL